MSPLVCKADEKPALEAANCIAQLEYIEHLVGRGVLDIRESHVRELQKLCVEKIYPCGGNYRTWTRRVILEGDGATHVPPDASSVPGYVQEMLDRINGTAFSNVNEKAAYALWRFNWIHPFAGGNGRTSRALCYLVLCIDFGSLMPGSPTFPTLISNRYGAYIDAIRVADAAEKEGREDLEAMTNVVALAASAQLANAAMTTKEIVLRFVRAQTYSEITIGRVRGGSSAFLEAAQAQARHWTEHPTYYAETEAAGTLIPENVYLDLRAHGAKDEG